MGMRQSTLKNLEYFVGKPCTILVSQIARQFTDAQFNDYFVGIVESANEDGVMTVHPITSCKNFYPMSRVVAISEEQMLDPSQPEQAELIEEFKTQANPSPYADIDVMADLARQAKELEKKK